MASANSTQRRRNVQGHEEHRRKDGKPYRMNSEIQVVHCHNDLSSKKHLAVVEIRDWLEAIDDEVELGSKGTGEKR